VNRINVFHGTGMSTSLQPRVYKVFGSSRLYVCLFVCLSVRSYISKITNPKILSIFVNVTRDRSPVLL